MVPRISGKALFVAFSVVAATGAAITTGAFIPAFATGAEGPTSFSGTSSAAVVVSVNKGNGAAVEAATGTVSGGQALVGVGSGSLTSSLGVKGKFFGPSSLGVFGQAVNTDASHPSFGVEGSSASGNGVYAKTTLGTAAALFAKNLAAGNNGVAIQGVSGGNAVIGQSSGSNGVIGVTTATPPAQVSGVLGQESSAFNGHNAGVSGTSTHNMGVFGESPNYQGVLGDVGGDCSLSAAIGVGGCSISASGGIWGAAISGGWGVYGTSDTGPGLKGLNGTDSSPVLYVTGGAGGTAPTNHALVTFHSKDTSISCNSMTLSNIDVFSVDFKGNLYICGTTTTGSDPLVAHRALGGHTVGTYSAQQTTQTLEDFGEAQLVNGQARIRLDPAYAALIDHTAQYLVFITPLGDTPGWLYVSQRTPTGFVVGEHGAGTSTVAFDYRIVAKPVDASARRLPLIDARPQPVAIGSAPRVYIGSIRSTAQSGYIPRPLPAPYAH